MSNSSALPHPWKGDYHDSGFRVTLLSELAMMAASNAIREKPNWWTKYKDPIISARWKDEILKEGNSRVGGETPPLLLTDKHIDYIFKELDWYAEKRQNQIDDNNDLQAPIEIGIDGTRRSDGLIPSELKQRLLACVEKLKDKPDHLLDWHPGSDNQVLDLVHPSLFPFGAGRTKVTKQEAIPPLDFSGQGKVMDAISIPRHIHKDYWSKKYQWLPTDFEVTTEGKVKARSYINNLHPIEHKDMYPVLEEILEKFLPMFEQVLADMRVFDTKEQRLETDPYNWYGEMPKKVKEMDESKDNDEGEDKDEDKDENEDEDEDSDHDEEDYRRNRLPLPADVPEFVPNEDPERYDLKSRGKLQVIVKLANIELTPENPYYDGSTWHVEGMANENIVASGIYYYNSENIEDSRLNFRIQVAVVEYEQCDDKGCGAMYGLETDEPSMQYLDGIITKQDRCVAFPNIYQHQVQPFGLKDPSQPGSRSILAFFLVNPERPILSTTNVPPQQKEWVPMWKKASGELPPEIVTMIGGMVDWPMDMEEAKQHRKEMMMERKYFVEKTNEKMFERPFSLCEH
ncbi:hypothetical protein BGX26_011157 [Mortierella sp. AD094]|nr:hypothetical protein BGX26_011157 [Mortierella sp. AD094]